MADKIVSPGKRQRMTDALAQITAGRMVRNDELTDDEVNAVTELFKPWKSGEQVYQGDDPKFPQSLRVFDGVLYKCMTTHVTHDGWKPDVANTVWSRVAKTVDGYEIWKEWDGHNENLYQVDDIVWYPDAGGQLYIATLGNNYWQPDSGTGWAVYEG